jgi:hypothetical protein
MPVQKFRTPDEARVAQRSVAGSEQNIRRLRAILDFWSKARPRRILRGVHKYHSVQEAQQDADLSRR